MLTTVHEAAGSVLHHRVARRPRGGRAGRGLAPGAVGRRRRRRRRQRRRRAGRRRRTRTCASSTPRRSPSARSSSAPSARSSSATRALDWITLGFGSANGKVFLETKLAGRGARGTVTGAYATRGRQHLDFDTLQEHAAPDTTSDLAFRGILGDRSSTVWRGMIQVDRGAQRTDAFQESRNLLLSKKAHADAIPGLEILANDVRCTHAAAIAQIDRDQLFYLRSHGLAEPQAPAARRRGLPRGDRRALRGGPGARRRRRRDRAPAGDGPGSSRAADWSRPSSRYAVAGEDCRSHAKAEVLRASVMIVSPWTSPHLRW